MRFHEDQEEHECSVDSRKKDEEFDDQRLWGEQEKYADEIGSLGIRRKSLVQRTTTTVVVPTLFNFQGSDSPGEGALPAEFQ